MTKDEYKAKIAEINQQEVEFRRQRRQVKKEFKDSLLKKLEEQGITPGTKVLVKAKSWKGDDVEIESYFFNVDIVDTLVDNVRYIFNKVKKDGTMSQVNHPIYGNIISINKI